MEIVSIFHLFIKSEKLKAMQKYHDFLQQQLTQTTQSLVTFTLAEWNSLPKQHADALERLHQDTHHLKKYIEEGVPEVG